MSDDPTLTPAQEEEVRRLLADARHTEPIPAEVAARLDRVLGGLSGEPAREAAVVRLAARRRRAATMLVAAAAVVVAGVGIGQVLDTDGLGEAGTTSQDAEPGAAEAEGDVPAHEGAREDRDLVPQAQRERTAVRIRPDRFAADVEGLRAQVLASYTEGGVAADESPQALRRSKASVCEPGAWGQGEYQPIRYAGSVGYVVFRPPQGDTQVADLFLCGSELAVRSVTLPSP